MTASAAGTRIDCVHCGHHVASHFLPADELRRLTGYVRLDEGDYCPRCALQSSGIGRRRREGDRSSVSAQRGCSSIPTTCSPFGSMSDSDGSRSTSPQVLIPGAAGWSSVTG